MSDILALKLQFVNTHFLGCPINKRFTLKLEKVSSYLTTNLVVSIESVDNKLFVLEVGYQDIGTINAVTD